MKYDIEVDGLPDGWEPVSYAVPKWGDYYIDSMDNIIIGPAVVDLDVQRRIIVRRKVRKYDWSKTLDDVLVTIDGESGYHSLRTSKCVPSPREGIADIWQANVHGKCPVDPEASIVRIQGGSEHGDLAGMMDWQRVKAWQFVRLADGVEW